jgi:hypothetical protein
MNIFKRLFNWIQSAPADFCYVTGEWGLQGKTTPKPAMTGHAFQSANNRRSSVVLTTVPVSVAARVAAFAAFPAPAADRDFPLPELAMHSAAMGVQGQNHAQTYAQTAG